MQSEFKKGCESGGNSYVENNDGSYQCNLKDGHTIKCADQKSQHDGSEQGLESAVFRRLSQLRKLG
jgi:hypothetical protein